MNGKQAPRGAVITPTKILKSSTVRIHQAPTGRWFYTPETVPYLDESGSGFDSKRSAKRAARAAGFSMWFNDAGKWVRLPFYKKQ